MSYRDTYQSWLDSAVLSQEEKAELTAIQNDEKEIESRFFEQLSFGTAGLRGTMGMGLYRMNVYTRPLPRSSWRKARRRSSGAWPCATTAAITRKSLPRRPRR